MVWLKEMMNNILVSKKFPKLWRKSKVIAILKPGNDSSLPKSYRPIPLLCHTYKLLERMVLNNPSAAYNHVNHRSLLTKLYVMSEDVEFTKLIGSTMSNRRFYVELNGKKSRWRNQKNGLPQGSVLSPVLFNVYTNDQHVHNETRSFIYAGDLCIATQRRTFELTETILTEALQNLGKYYERNHLRANPGQTQTCIFHLKNREAHRKLNIAWYNKHLEHIPNPVYLGITLDRTLSYKEHIHKLKSKTYARNNSSCTLLLYRGICIVLCGKDQHT